MEFDNAFEVPLPIEAAWKVLMDVGRIAPCMPGAELTEVVDARTYKGKIGVRLGPVALSFVGTVRFEEIDDTGHRARVAAQGSDAKGRGAANAVATFQLEPVNGGSRVLVHTNLTLSGAVAQYGRGVGIIQLTAAQIITQFANNLKARLAQDAASAPSPPMGGEGRGEGGPPSAQTRGEATSPAPSPHSPSKTGVDALVLGTGGDPTAPAAKPISGFALIANVLWQAIKRLFPRA